jgi:predicted RNase H-like HicB family nuclease
MIPTKENKIDLAECFYSRQEECVTYGNWDYYFQVGYIPSESYYVAVSTWPKFCFAGHSSAEVIEIAKKALAFYHEYGLKSE